jgi:hypothetical protein
MVRFICKSVFLNFVHLLRVAQPGGPTARVSVLPTLPEDGRRSSFRNVVIVLKYRRWTVSKNTLSRVLSLFLTEHQSLSRKAQGRFMFNFDSWHEVVKSSILFYVNANTFYISGYNERLQLKHRPYSMRPLVYKETNIPSHTYCVWRNLDSYIYNNTTIRCKKNGSSSCVLS